jgi:hypothetical protein
MNKFDSNMSRLFRSVGADESELKAANSAVAQEAEQRWPLLKAMAPAKPESTPPLPPRARQHTDPVERPAASGRKPALTLPSVGVKLATSLNKMAAKPVIARSSISAPEPGHANMASITNFTSSTSGIGKSFPNQAKDGRQSLFASQGTGRAQPDDTANLFIKPAKPVKFGMFARALEEPSRQEETVSVRAQRVNGLISRPRLWTAEAKTAFSDRRIDAPAEQQDARRGLFGKRPEKNIIAKPVSLSPREKRLSDIFAQIENNGAKIMETQSRSSIFNRLGKP